MERLDFASITQILRNEASEGRFMSQLEFADALLFELSLIHISEPTRPY